MESQAFSTFLARLGLFEDEEPLTADNYGSMADREWRLSKMNPMGANLVFVVHDHSIGGQTVQVFLNEQQIQLPGCENLMCTMMEIRAAWEPITLSCNFDEMCEMPDLEVTTPPQTCKPEVVY